MNDIVDFRALLIESRPRVYLLWAILTGIGYVATHFYQNKNINFVWFVLASIGLYYMFRVMPLRVSQMRYIYLSWLIPIMIGLGSSIIAVRTGFVPELVGYLGVFWLTVQAVAFFWNGLSDSPGLWYYIAAATSVAAAIAIYMNDELLRAQYLIAAVVTAWSMLMLWVFRSE